MSEPTTVQAELDAAEEELRELMQSVEKIDCAGRAHGPQVDMERLERIEELEERIAELKTQIHT